MVFIVIIVLSLIATYLLISSGVLKDFKLFKKSGDESIYAYEIDELVPGMLGSAPSNNIDVYDSRRPITIPMEGAIETLIISFKDAANQVYIDFKNNKNSAKYKEYVFNDYKIEILRRNESLSDKQLGEYLTTRNTVVRDINNIFTYYLDKIKYSEDKSYFTLRREILNSSGTGLILDEREVDSIANYVLSNTKIPGAIILLLKYKVSIPAQELIDQIVMLAGFNYTTVLETLEQVLIREPLPGITILGIVNSSASRAVDDVTTVTQGFWTQVHYTFKSNNIDNFLIALIRLSFMTEQIYRAILATIVSSMQNPKLTEAMNLLVKMCRESNSKMIKTFPYNFTHALLIDAINENRSMLRNNRVINVAQVDRETTGISNIENYSNIEYNFPVIVQNLELQSSKTSLTVSYEFPVYHILSDDYMVNNYLSFPNIKHRGVYLDRTTSVAPAESGYIMITNSATVDLTVAGIIIYATLQDGFINDDKRDMSITVVDSNIVTNSALVTVEAGKYESNEFKDAVAEPTNSHWLTGSNITIPASKSIRIRATKQSSVIGIRYLRIYAVLIPFVSKPISDFLRVSVIQDRTVGGEVIYNHFDFTKVPKEMPNIFTTFDSAYNISTPSARVSDTFRIIGNNIPASANHNRLMINGSTGGTLTYTIQANVTKSSLIDANGAVLTPTGLSSATGLVTDTRTFIPAQPNTGRSAYRIRLKNTSSTPTPITISKLIFFGSVGSSSTSSTIDTLAGFLADDNVLLRTTHINMFTMNDTENSVTRTISPDFVIDQNFQSVDSGIGYLLLAGQSLYIEPTFSTFVTAASQYVNIRAMYIEVSGTNKSALSLSIISLNLTGGNKIATLDINTGVWDNGAALIILNPPGAGAASYSAFSVLPEYKQDRYSVLPKYMESKFQSDYYDQYYDPVSELVQYPSNFY